LPHSVSYRSRRPARAATVGFLDGVTSFRRPFILILWSPLMSVMHSHSPSHAAARWLATCFVATLGAVAQVHAADLSVTVKGARSAQGLVLVALYDGAETFLKPGKHAAAQMAPADAQAVTVVFHNLPVGRYALTTFHDENANGKLDFNLTGSPVEALGFSNDAFGTAAAPAFDKAVIELTADAAITIQLR
jgi:uncharacterized protein (DUF2141 family)